MKQSVKIMNGFVYVRNEDYIDCKVVKGGLLRDSIVRKYDTKRGVLASSSYKSVGHPGANYGIHKDDLARFIVECVSAGCELQDKYEQESIFVFAGSIEECTF